MIEKKCPIEGYADFVISYPAELLVKHQRQFAQGLQAAIEANPDVTINEARFEGCKSICTRWDVPKKLQKTPLDEWPLAVFNWVLDCVYFGHYEPAANPPKNS